MGERQRFWIGYAGGVYDQAGKHVGEVVTAESGHAEVEFFDQCDVPAAEAWFSGPDPEGRP